MKTFFTKSLLTLPLLGLVPGSADAQIYTDEQINSDVCLLPYEWNMRDNEYSFGQYCGPFPAGFNRFNVIETGAFIHSDLNPTTGRANSASTLYRLHTVDQSPKRYLGGEYTVQIIGNVDAPYSIYGSFNMRRGSENYDHNYFEDVAFSANRRRAFGRVDYLNMGVAPVTKTTTDYYFPIGHWDMSTSASQPLKVKSISLPNMDINKIVGVSTIIYSNSVGGKIKADQFDRRGSTQTSINGETVDFTRGGIVNVISIGGGTSSQIDLSLRHTLSFGGKTNLFARGNHTGTAANRGWVRVTYLGTAAGVYQPYAMKTKVRKIGDWPISSRAKDWSRIFNFSDFGIQAGRLSHADVAIHQDDRGTEHDVAPLKKTPYGDMPAGGNESGLFTIDEAANKFKMYATYYFAGPVGEYSQGYYAENHYSTNYNRGYARVDYVAAACSTSASGYSIKAIPSATNGSCGGGFGSLTTVKGAGGDIWDANDEFSFMYKRFTAGENKTFTAKIESQTNTEGWAKAGIMFRSSLAANAKHASMLATPVNGTHFTWRPDGTNTATSRTSNSTIKAPYWLRVQKVGKVFTAFWSANGSTWSQVGSPQTINSFGSTFYVGFAVSSRTSGMSTAVFSNVSGI